MQAENNNVILRENERIDDLQVNGLHIIQNEKAFRFGCDAVELANFVTGGCHDLAADLGSGSGIIAILLAGKKNIPCDRCFKIRNKTRGSLTFRR